MLFSIVEGSGSISRCCMLVHLHSGEIIPTIIVALAGEQLCMVEDPGVKLLWRWVRDEVTSPLLHQSREVGIEVHSQTTIAFQLMIEGGGKGAMHWLPVEGSSGVGVGGTSFPGPRV